MRQVDHYESFPLQKAIVQKQCEDFLVDLFAAQVTTLTAALRRQQPYLRRLDFCAMKQPSLLMAGDGPAACTCGLRAASEAQE